MIWNQKNLLHGNTSAITIILQPLIYPLKKFYKGRARLFSKGHFSQLRDTGEQGHDDLKDL